MATTYTTPTIHLNGTGAETLARETENAREALAAAREALAALTCHGRDFYPQGPDAYPQAARERAEAFGHLEAAEEYLDAWVVSLWEGGAK